MKLIIVESPTKCSTIKKYLGKGYEVIASMGHIRDLSTSGKGGLGVDIPNDFTPTYIVNKDKRKVVEDLIKAKNKASEVYLATDPDREGEAISWHLASVLDLDVNTTKRLEFHEITKKAINKAIENPRTIDMDLVSSQETRRIIDRIMGFELSTLLKKKIHSLSAGRVQSVALKLITDREKEVQSFVPSEYYVIQGEFKKMKAKLDLYNGRDITITSYESALEILNALKDKDFVVSNKKVSTRSVEPKLPFKTSSLQQEAFNRFHFSTKATQSYAQKLFELGLITYIRTDGIGYAEEFIEHGKNYVSSNYGSEYLASASKYKSLQVKDDTKLAHEAIRTTSLENTPESLKGKLDASSYKLYKLIYERSLSSLMAPKKEEVVSLRFECSGYSFHYEEVELLFDGFLKVTSVEKEEKQDYKNAKKYEVGDVITPSKIFEEKHLTKGPVRYNEARLVKMMEDVGIGRPSTYAATIATLYEREYIVSEKGILVPTEQGILTIERLSSYFPEFMDTSFTADMEKELDDVTLGNGSRSKILNDFYTTFSPLYEKAKNEMPGSEVVYTENTCPKCGKPLVKRKSRFGTFEACSGFPTCKYVLKEENEVEDTGKICPQCGKPLVKRKSKRGEFYACSGFPTCKYIEGQEEKKDEVLSDKTCPKCGKPLAIKKGKRGKGDFLACTGFPVCKHIETIEKK